MNIYLDTLLHLPHATVESFREVEDFIYFKIGLINEEIKCPHCEKIIAEINQVESVLIRDLPAFGRKVYLAVPRRQFYGSDCHKYSTERLDFVEFHHRHTRRYEESIYAKVRRSNIEEVSREEELSREKVPKIFTSIEASKKKDWEPPKRIGIDEFACRKGHQDFNTVVSDIDKGKPLEIISGRESDQLIEVLSEQDLEVREGVEEVSVDMWEGFPKAIQSVFPNARILSDRFHVMKHVNQELNRLRIKLKVTGRKKIFVFEKWRELTRGRKKSIGRNWKRASLPTNRDRD